MSFLYSLIAYVFLVGGLGIVLATGILYINDAMRQEPRFKVLMRFMLAMFFLGIGLILIASMTGWPVVILIPALFITFFPVTVSVMVSGGLMLEAAKSANAISIMVMGALGSAAFGIFLLAVKGIIVSAGGGPHI